MNRREREAIDEEVISEIARGHLAAAATRALRAYGPHVLGFLWLILRQDEAAEETFAQFSEDLWRGIGSFRGECAFRTWTYQLAYNAARRYLKDPFRRRGRRLVTTEVSRLAGEIRESTHEFRKTSAHDAFERLRGRLDPEEQTLLMLRIDQQMPWRDVAEVMSEEGRPLDPAALRKRYERLKVRLRELAQAEGLVKPKDERD